MAINEHNRQILQGLSAHFPRPGSFVQHKLLKAHQQAQLINAASRSNLDHRQLTRSQYASNHAAYAFTKVYVAGSRGLQKPLHPIFGHAQSSAQIAALRQYGPNSPISSSPTGWEFGLIGRLGAAAAASIGSYFNRLQGLQTAATISLSIACQLSACIGLVAYLAGMEFVIKAASIIGLIAFIAALAHFRASQQPQRAASEERLSTAGSNSNSDCFSLADDEGIPSVGSVSCGSPASSAASQNTDRHQQAPSTSEPINAQATAVSPIPASPAASDDDELGFFSSPNPQQTGGLQADLDRDSSEAIRSSLETLATARPLDPITPQAQGARFSAQAWTDLFRSKLWVFTGGRISKPSEELSNSEASRRQIVQQLLALCNGSQQQLHALSSLMHQGLLADMIDLAPQEAKKTIISLGGAEVGAQIQTEGQLLKFAVHSGSKPGSVRLVAIYSGSVNELTDSSDVYRYMPTQQGSWLRYECRLEIAPPDDKGRCALTVKHYGLLHNLKVAKDATWQQR